MQRTKIEWVVNPDRTRGYSTNPIKGACPMGCEYCYASGKRGFLNRFKLDRTLRYDWSEMDQLAKLKKPSTVFICSTNEWLWDHKTADKILDYCRIFHRHTFYLLTKLPERLVRIGVFPSNVRVGVSCVNQDMFDRAMDAFGYVNASCRFISFEPLQEYIDISWAGSTIKLLNWGIIGAQTNPLECPPKGAVRDIIVHLKRQGVPIFLKDNLKKCLKMESLLQELPRP